MAEIIAKESGIEKIEIFGDVDKVNGKVGSEYPAWYFEPQTQEIREDIRRLEHSLKEGLIPEKGKPQAMADMRRAQEKLDKIESSKPRISDNDRDEIAKATDKLGDSIKSVQFSKSEEERGTVDPHEVVERMFTPCIKLDGRGMAMAEKMGCRVQNGQVSVNDASRIWKTYRRSIGETTNVEKLRRA